MTLITDSGRGIDARATGPHGVGRTRRRRRGRRTVRETRMASRRVRRRCAHLLALSSGCPFPVTRVSGAYRAVTGRRDQPWRAVNSAKNLLFEAGDAVRARSTAGRPSPQLGAPGAVDEGDGDPRLGHGHVKPLMPTSRPVLAAAGGGRTGAVRQGVAQGRPARGGVPWAGRRDSVVPAGMWRGPSWASRCPERAAWAVNREKIPLRNLPRGAATPLLFRVQAGQEGRDGVLSEPFSDVPGETSQLRDLRRCEGSGR